MKKTQEIRLKSNGEDMDDVLNEATSFSGNMNLSEKDALRIRLLTEETMSMIRTLTGEPELSLSFIGQENECIIRIETDTRMDFMKKEDILAVSSSGKNASAKGVMGKIRDVFETLFTMPADSSFEDFSSSSGLQGMPGDMYSGPFMDTVYWTLSDYRSSVESLDETPDKKERWDELEKSIVSNIADDVQVGVRGGHVVMTISYKIHTEQEDK